MVVRQNVTLLVDNHPRTKAVLCHWSRVGEIKKVVPEVAERALEFAREPWLFRRAMHLRGRNVYHRGLHILNNRSKSARQMNRIGYREGSRRVFAHRFRNGSVPRQYRADYEPA